MATKPTALLRPALSDSDGEDGGGKGHANSKSRGDWGSDAIARGLKKRELRAVQLMAND